MRKLLVAISAFNEAVGLEVLLPQIPRQLGSTDLDIMVIDDGSSDGTGSVAERLGARVISLTQNRGKLAAMRHAFDLVSTGRYDACITMDADGQHNPSSLDSVVDQLRAGYEVVFTSRYHRDSEIRSHPPLDRFLLNVAYASLIRKLTGMKLTDPVCGLRGLTTPVLRRLQFNTDRYGLELETVLRVWQMPDVTWCELPIPMIYNGSGKLAHIYDAEHQPQRLERFGIHAGDMMAVLDDLGLGVPELLDIIHRRNGESVVSDDAPRRSKVAQAT